MIQSHSLSYILSLLPIGVATVLFPPLSVFHPNEYQDVPSCVNEEELEAVLLPVYYSFPDVLWNNELVSGMLLDSSSQRKLCVKPQHFTCLFVHETFGHIALDLWNFVKYAYPVFNAKGWMFMNTIYVVGGALARLPYFKAFSTSQTTALTYFEDLMSSLAEPFVANLDTHWIFHGGKRECGSSPAAYALLGSSTVIALEKIFQALFSNNRYHTKSDEDNSYDAISTSMLMTLVMNGWTVGTNLSALHREWELMQYEEQPFSVTTFPSIKRHSYEGLWWQYILPRHPYNANATVHVQGFLLGAIMTIASRCISS